MVLLCWLKLSTLLDRYRAIIIEHIQPYAVSLVTESVNPTFKRQQLDNSGIPNRNVDLLHLAHVHTYSLLSLTPILNSVTSLRMAKHQQMNSVGSEVCRVLHVIMHIKIP